MNASTVWATGNITQIATALVMVAPSPDFVDGVLALCVALGAVTPQMQRAAERPMLQIEAIEQ